MIGIDTNILLRYLTKDDEVQVRKVRELFGTGEKLFVSDVVLAEAVWVLGRKYRFSKREIVETLEAIVENEIFALDDPSIVQAALTDYRDGKGDFADYLIGRRNATAGCEHTVTFDADLSDHPAFVIF